MPYISKSRREKFPHIPVADTAPELAYLLAQTAVAHFRKQAQAEDTKSLATVNLGVVGAFEQAKTEFNNTIVASYEAERKAENGDVFGSFDAPAPGLKPQSLETPGGKSIADFLLEMGITTEDESNTY